MVGYFAMNLPCFLLVVILLQYCSAQSLVFRIEVLNSTSSAELASLVSAVNETNAVTAARTGGKAFLLEVRNSPPGSDLVRYATSLSEERVVALIEGANPNPTTCMLSTLAGIPLVRIHSNKDCCFKCDHVLSLTADTTVYAGAVSKLMDTFKWGKVAVIFEENWLDFTMRVLPFITEHAPHYLPFYKRTNESIAMTLVRMMTKLAGLDVRLVLLHVDNAHHENFLTAEPCDPERSYVWILHGKVPSRLSARSDHTVVALALHRETNQQSKDYHSGDQDNVDLAFDAGRVISQALTDMSNDRDWLPFPNGSSLYGPVQEKARFRQILRNVSLTGMSGKLKFDEEGRRVSVALDVWSLTADTFTKIGSWTSAGLNLTASPRKNEGVGNDATSLVGRKFRVVTVEEPPFVVFHQLADRKVHYEGYCIDILSKLASQLGFTYEIHPSPDGFYGTKTDGRWNGAVGNLVRQDADMIVASLTVTDAREEVVDFTVAYMQYTSDLIMRKEVTEEVHYLQFLHPFKDTVWVMLLVCLIVMTLATFAVNYFSPYGYKDSDGRGTASEFNLLNSAWFSLACMLQQGGDNTPKSLSGRILAGCFWFCILIWVSTYTANLAAFLTVKNTHFMISSFREAVQSDYDIGVMMASATYEFFRSSEVPLYNRAWHNMRTRNLFPSNTSEGIRWAREREKFVFVENGPLLEYEANKKPCDLVTIPGLTIDRALGFALATNDPHTDDISLGILHLLQEGFMEEMRMKWWDSSECSKKKVSVLSSQRIDIESMLGVYIVLSVGILASFLVLAAENLWFKYGHDMLISHLQRNEAARRNANHINVQPMEGTY